VGALTAVRQPAATVILGMVGLLAAAVVANRNPSHVAPLVVIVCVFAAWHVALLRWQSMIAVMVVVVLVVPIKAYHLPGSLPFDLELYRLLVAVFLLCWMTSLLIDPRVRLRRSAFDTPLVVMVFAVLASELANPGRVETTSSYVAKSLTFFLSFVLLYFFVVSVLRNKESIRLILKVMVAVGTGVAVFALVERRTEYNVFHHLSSVLPFLHYEGARESDRLGRLRVIGSAQHPIAFGAALALMVPLSVALARTASRRWWITTVVLLLGVLATASRTAIIMLIIVGLVFLWLKPLETKRLAPLLVPAIVVVHFAVPGALVTLKEAFFPQGGLIAEQSNLAQGSDPNQAGGRIRLLRPSLEEWSRTPVAGQGWGTRVTAYGTGLFRNAPILDNQWLGTLLETGLLGVGAWLWLFLSSVRRLGGASKESEDDDSWLFAGLAAALAGFAVGMFTYDTFSFIQVTFLFWIVLGLAAAALDLRSRPAREPEPASP